MAAKSLLPPPLPPCWGLAGWVGWLSAGFQMGLVEGGLGVGGKGTWRCPWASVAAFVSEVVSVSRPVSVCLGLCLCRSKPPFSMAAPVGGGGSW